MTKQKITSKQAEKIKKLEDKWFDDHVTISGFGDSASKFADELRKDLQKSTLKKHNLQVSDKE
jgi:hypothetical protein|tara:strand:+ start:159 stop:347 length:189 start_codon:yes stop_codon:yes gene_type:complete